MAAALAVPLRLADGQEFPFRREIIFVTFCVVVATLVVQGLTLPLLLRVLKIHEDFDDMREEARTQLRLAEIVLKELDDLHEREKLPEYIENALRQHYVDLRERARHDSGEIPPEELEYPHRTRVVRQLLAVERRELLRMHRENQVSEIVFQRLLARLDHREAML
jgi:CPA1 family monovalent cation:H+ antiporter